MVKYRSIGYTRELRQWDIFRLDGLVRLIENLGFSESQSELRAFLSNEVQERLQLWSELTEGLIWPHILKQGEHFDLHHYWDVDAVFGIHINILPTDSDIGQSVAANKYRRYSDAG